MQFILSFFGFIITAVLHIQIEKTESAMNWTTFSLLMLFSNWKNESYVESYVTLSNNAKVLNKRGWLKNRD